MSTLKIYILIPLFAVFIACVAPAEAEFSQPTQTSTERATAAPTRPTQTATPPPTKKRGGCETPVRGIYYPDDGTVRLSREGGVTYLFFSIGEKCFALPAKNVFLDTRKWGADPNAPNFEIEMFDSYATMSINGYKNSFSEWEEKLKEAQNPPSPPVFGNPSR